MNDSRLRFSDSLSAKLLLAALLSLLAAGLIYLMVFSVGSFTLERYYMSTEAVASRKAKIYTDFSKYISQNSVDGRDTEAVSRFLQHESYVSVTVYPAAELGLSSSQIPGGFQSLEPPQRSGIGSKLYPIRFTDGIYYITITDNSQIREETLNRVMGLIFAATVLVSLLLWYTNGLTHRIIRLSQETSAVGSGDLDGAITVEGRDEIAALAADIDGMRDSIIQRMGDEKRAWEANSELITAMSHDIRTPMTSLIGYLGLLSDPDMLSESDRKHYVEAAYGKALDLKALTDELFKYFLVFGSSELKLHCEEFDIHLLLMQLLGEAEFDLRESGLNVQNIDHLEDGYLVSTDPAMLKRVIDNLVSNLKKYADRERPVILLTEMREKAVSVTVSNAVQKHSSKTESTKIGLRTCEKIMTSLGGSFSTARDEEHFAAEFTIPLKQKAS